MEIEKSVLPIDAFTAYGDACFAHRSNNGEETLKEHTERCQKYWTRMIKKKKLDPVFSEFEAVYLDGLGTEAKALFECMTANIVTLHDIGKVNPRYQKTKMGHAWHKEAMPDANIGSKHSILSSVFYLDHFIGKINTAFKEEQQITKEESDVLKNFAYIYSYIISRHHGSLGEFESYVNGLAGRQNDGENLGKRARNWFGFWKMEVMNQGAPAKYGANWKLIRNGLQKMNQGESRKAVYLYGMTRLLYSLLVASDYYATAEFMTGLEISDFGDVKDIDKISEVYEDGEILQKIRTYEKETYPMEESLLRETEDINVLRTEMFLDAEKALQAHPDQSLYYLEAPTGSGKSNTAFNLSFTMMRLDPELNKIFYIYPFNTLVEQNMSSIEKVFNNKEEVMSEVAVVNSLVPMKSQTEEEDWNKILLDRQFLNYPMILSTHVTLFRTLFGNKREDVFGFYQLSNSVIVLDEIQSYKNNIWSEIITFLKGFANLLHIKILIMSATLPNLELLTDNHSETVRLIENREKYFRHKQFTGRVTADYSLLKGKITMDDLVTHVLQHAIGKTKVLIEFLTKKSAQKCYACIKSKTNKPVFLMTGDSSILERKNIIKKIEELPSAILVATEVVEAGVDIDMDIGYKDISGLDSEEQFMGRINRSGLRNGIAYFFDMDDASGIYKGDKRIEKEKTLANETIREYLTTKDFEAYYEKEIVPLLVKEGRKLNENNLEDFFCEGVGYLDMEKVSSRMRLIDDKRQVVSLYLGRVIHDENGEKLDGRSLWEQYKELLETNEMDYPEKKVKLHDIRSKMNAFIYEFTNQIRVQEDEQIGDLYYIENGEEYFDENDILIYDMFRAQIA